MCLQEITNQILLESQTDCFPVDSMRIATLYNIPVYRIAEEHITIAPKQEVLGGLDFKDGTPRIHVRKNLSSVQTRLITAHILGHIFLGHTSDKPFIEDSRVLRSTFWEPAERAANLFAMELLMPEEDVKSVILRGASNLKELAARFGVSEHIIYLRLYNLGIL